MFYSIYPGLFFANIQRSDVQIYCNFLSSIRYKNGWVLWFVQLFFGREDRETEFVQKRMDILNYTLERLLDVTAALALRAGYRWVDRYFAAFAATDTSGVATNAGVPLGTSRRTGSGSSPSIIGGGGARRNPSGDQHNGRAGGMTGGDDVVLDLTVAE